MRFEAAQHLKLGQQMKLAPRMIQSMEILQLPMMALQERIDQELESNVALEIVEPGSEDGDAGSERERMAEEATDEKLDRRELVVGDDGGGSADFERLSAFESSYERDAFENTYSSERYSASRQAGERDRKVDAMANIAARGEGLVEQLLHQWSFAEVAPRMAELGKLLIGYINSDGLLSADLETILEQNHSVPGMGDAGLTVEQLEEALKLVQHWLDPPGIGARSQRECLLLQVKAMEEQAASSHESSEAWADVRLLIEEHFDDLLQNRLPRIQQATNLTMQRIQAAIQMMRKLKLHPGSDLAPTDAAPIIPDVLVEYDEQSDSYIAALTDGVVPPLRVSPKYEQMAKDSSIDKSTREFVAGNVRSATWLIESINQRKNTLLRVVNVVLSRQRDFFDYGPQHLKPLPMIEVADQLGVHVATVSRAVADKWLQTPRGLVPLRKFFSGGTETESGQNVSWEAIKAMLKEVVDAEDKSRPLSDEALAEELRKRGIEIARRTVVKYRQQLDIPPARRRKIY